MKTYFVNFFIVFTVLYNKTVIARTSNIFDQDLYESVLDTAECERQLNYIRNNDTSLGLEFLDTSWRLPRGILRGNTIDLGNYLQCLDINEDVDVRNMIIEGKFCMVQMPLQQDDLLLPTLPIFPNSLPEFNLRTFYTEKKLEKLNKYGKVKSQISTFVGSPEDTSLARNIDGGDLSPKSLLSSLSFELAMCVPKVCTTRQAIDFISPNVTNSLIFEENFCRLPNDKKWMASDTIAVTILSIIGVFTILSTAYDIRHTILLKKDPKKANKIYQCFSVYTNTISLFTFPSSPSAVTCLEGIRSFAMIWVIVGHTFYTQLIFIPENPLDFLDFMTKFTSLWITSNSITVDSFFVISGLLVVYTTVQKTSRSTLMKTLHLFYLNRILRMWPVLAFMVLLKVSFLHRLADGPYFTVMEELVSNCRNNWWSTMLFVQNFVHPLDMCLPQTWYLAVDFQLHILSPIVLFWVLGQRKRTAWSTMVAALLAVLIGSTVYNFINNFQSSAVALSRPPVDGFIYKERYYVHTLPRAAPFFVGMLYGYLLHVYRGKTPKIPMPLVLICWILAFAGTTQGLIVSYWNFHPQWDNQLMDNLINSYMRPIWATSVGWMIFACHKGYGGPINWFLSLTVFKFLGRLSYAMYVIHYSLIYLINATTLAPIYFSTQFSVYRFFIDFSLALIAAVAVTVVIENPLAILIKMGLALITPKKNPKEQTKEKPALMTEKPEKENAKDAAKTDLGHENELKTAF